MKLNLQPYNPTEELRARAQSALQVLSSEWAAIPPPQINTDNDQVERARAAARKWRSTDAGRKHEREYRAAYKKRRKEAALA